jgi:hypothetical protein
MTHISPKVGGCELGNMVHDYALGMNGIVVGGAWVQPRAETGASTDHSWEWLVLYDDGDLMGADTNDLQVVT